jgi:hypothetical protein
MFVKEAGDGVLVKRRNVIFAAGYKMWLRN